MTADETDGTGPTRHPGRPAADPAGAMLGRVLRTGVVISAGLLIIGIVLAFADGSLSGGTPELDQLRSGEASGTSFAERVATAGLVVLVATPVVRVAVAGWEMRRRGDRIFAAIAALILGLLLISFVADLVA